MRRLLTALFMLLIAACGDNSQPEIAEIKIENAHISEPAQGRNVALGGMDITLSGQAIELIGVSSPSAERIELHTSTKNIETGHMRMQRIERLSIKPGEALKLGRGATHLMVFGLDSDLVPGDSAELTLRYVQNGDTEATQTVTAVITDIGKGS